jgi:hypothetical protein
MACDGSPRGGKARILDYTHANCIDHTASQLFYGISAAENLLIFGADVSNAFSEAPPPKQGFYILLDRAFNEWWEAKGLPPLLPGQVIPVMRAMQGHPKSSRLWEKHIDRIIRQYGFKPTAHEPHACIWEKFGVKDAFSNGRSMTLQLLQSTRRQPITSLTSSTTNSQCL